MNVAELQEKLQALLAKRDMDATVRTRILSVTDLRPLRVIAHILEQGSVSTEDLARLYGYNHAPRAARDVRELGIPLRTGYGKTAEGRRMAIYELDLATRIGEERTGRRVIAKHVRDRLIAKFNGHCAICTGRFANRILQIDHRIPYEIAGEVPDESQDETTLMPVCSSCNRSKSWECEHCPNWSKRDARTCQDCYWASPLGYSHAATVPMRRETITWTGDEVARYDAARRRFSEDGQRVAEAIKEYLARKR